MVDKSPHISALPGVQCETPLHRELFVAKPAHLAHVLSSFFGEHAAAHHVPILISLGLWLIPILPSQRERVGPS